MKICSFTFEGIKRVGILVRNSTLVDATLAYVSFLANNGRSRPYQLAQAILPSEMLQFLEGGDESLGAAREAEKFAKSNPKSTGPSHERLFYDLSEVRLLAPVQRPGKIFCGVLNAKSIQSRLKNWSDYKAPEHPFYFSKATSAVIGPDAPIEIPEFLAWPEVELAWIFNKPAKNIRASEFLDCIIGYTIFNDVTAGGLHASDTVRYVNPDGSEGMPFRFLSRYKGFDTFAPMGPWIVTKDEIPNPNNLAMRCWVGDTLVQSGNTNELSTTCEDLTEYITSVHTMLPGDVISGGTCSPAKGRMLNQNDLRKMGGPCKCEIAKIGTITNPIKPISTGLKEYASAAQTV